MGAGYAADAVAAKAGTDSTCDRKTSVKIAFSLMSFCVYRRSDG
jgi:hypothetical protein